MSTGGTTRPLPNFRLMMKLCPYCNTEKPEGDFIKTRGSQCRACRTAYMDAYRKKRKAAGLPPHHLTQNSNRLKTPRQWKSVRLVRQCIKHGYLIPATECEICGGGPKKLKRLDAHHADYLKPLEVIWLCRACHIHIHDAPDAHINAEGPVDPEIYRMPFKPARAPRKRKAAKEQIGATQ